MIAALIALLVLQDASKEPKIEDVILRVDREAVEQAVKKGVEYLYARYDAGDTKPFEREGVMHRYDDFLLLTLVHAGADQAEPRFQQILKHCVEGPLERTYDTSIQAMALAKLDKAKYQWRIAQCAQFLVDNQCPNGQWSYGDPVPLDHIKPPAQPPKPQKGTQALPRITIAKKRAASGGGGGPRNTGDNSNTQYAAMGLRAAFDASVMVPPKTLKEAIEWWEKDQHKDGGWHYDALNKDATGSMTAGGMGSLATLLYMMGAQPRTHVRCVAARKWMTDHWSVTQNPGNAGGPLYYYLYAIERAGTLFGTELFGEHEWYVEGAKLILGEQAKDGGWRQEHIDTCFAILFLRRATDGFRPPVATGK